VAQIDKCCRCECASCGLYGWVQKIADKVWFVRGFPHVFYKLWLVGVAASVS